MASLVSRTSPQLIDSLRPLGAMHQLRVIRFAGVVARDRDLRPLWPLRRLSELALPNHYPVDQLGRLVGALPTIVKRRARCGFYTGVRSVSTRPVVGDAAAFERFVADTGGQLRRALVAHFGIDDGPDITNDALLWAWEHWDHVQTMENPRGYLYRVGQSAARRHRRWRLRRIMGVTS